MVSRHRKGQYNQVNIGRQDRLPIGPQVANLPYIDL